MISSRSLKTYKFCKTLILLKIWDHTDSFEINFVSKRRTWTVIKTNQNDNNLATSRICKMHPSCINHSIRDLLAAFSIHKMRCQASQKSYRPPDSCSSNQWDTYGALTFCFFFLYHFFFNSIQFLRLCRLSHAIIHPRARIKDNKTQLAASGPYPRVTCARA